LKGGCSGEEDIIEGGNLSQIPRVLKVHQQGRFRETTEGGGLSQVPVPSGQRKCPMQLSPSQGLQLEERCS
jgi:hypothetical protein